MVGAGAVVMAEARLADGVVVGDGAHVRERTSIGPQTVLSRGVALGSDARIGAGVEVGADAFLTSDTIVEDDVRVGARVLTMNDDTMARHPPGVRTGAPVLRERCRVGAGVRLLPGCEVGAGAEVDAGALVRGRIRAGQHVAGVPAVPVAEALGRRETA